MGFLFMECLAIELEPDIGLGVWMKIMDSDGWNVPLRELFGGVVLRPNH